MKRIVYIGNHLTESNPTTMGALTKLLRESGCKVEVYSKQANQFKRLLAMCAGVIKHRNYDYVLIDTYSTLNFYYALIISQLARLFFIPYIPILHGGNLPARLARNPRLSRLIFKNSYVNVAPSNYLVTAFKEKGFRTQFIANSIHIESYQYQQRQNLQPNLLWVRAFDEIYNPLMAVEVLSLLKQQYPMACLCMIGPDKDGSLEKAKTMAKQLGVFDAIEFTGKLSKKEWIAKSKSFDIFINTTTVDNTPVSVLEAMALGLPVVSTNVGGIPYLLKNGEQGMLIENKKATEMMKSIAKLMENPALVKHLTTNAKRLVTEFDTGFVQQQWLKLLQE